jgi:hypothetical protein
MRLAFAVLTCFAISIPAVAQSTTGRISGTVSDASGAVLPGVTITVTEERTGYRRTAVTDERGAFVLVSMPNGTYTVVSELQGFRSEQKTANVLVADGRLTVDFALSLGQVQETVTVSALAESVNTVSGEVARTVDREQVQNLALNGRNYMQLATLIPGSPLLNDDALNIMTGLSIAASVNGSRQNANLLMVDGGFNMDSGSNNSQISNVGIDFIEEVTIKTANFSAEYGRNSGAAINVVTRSGTNQFAGSAFEYHRNDSLDDNSYFAELQKVEKAPLKYNNFGYSLGGPVRRGQLFFFGGQEWKVIRRSTSPTFRTLPTAAMRNGDFSALTTPIRDPLTNAPFPGNVIPGNRITADGRAIAAVYTAMAGQAVSYTDSATANNALFQADNPFDFRQEVLRLDWQANAAHRLTGRLIFDHYDLDDPFGTFINSQLPTIPTNRTRPGRNYQVSHAWTIGSSMVNEFKANVSSNGQQAPPIGDAWKRDTYGFAFAQLFSGGGRFEESIPDVDVQTYASFRGAAQSLLSPTRDIQITNNLTTLRGAHTFKVGGMLIRNSKDQNSRSPYAGFVSFNATGNPNSTGNAFADALLGNFRTYREAQIDQIGLFRFWQAEAFASDNWAVSDTFSIDAGLRYAWHQPIYTLANNMASFDPSRYDPARAVIVNRNGTLVPGSGDRYNGMVRAGDGVPDDQLSLVPIGRDPAVLGVPDGAPRGFYDAQHLIAPRFSFAWTPTNRSDTALRGGIGLFYDRPEGNLYFGAPAIINNPPYALSAEYENGNLAAPGGGSVPAPAPIAEIGAIDPNLKVPASWNWSVTMQRTLPWWGIFSEIGYVGSRGQNLLRQPDINQAAFDDLVANAALPAAQRANTNFLRPYRGYSAIRLRLSDAESSYHALQLFLSRRSGAFKWTASYTLSRSRDTASGNGDNPEDYTNADYNYGPSDFDRPHVFVGTWTLQLPFFRSEQGIGRVLGGWEVSGIARLQSGQAYTITGNTTIGVRRADYLGGDHLIPEDQRLVNNQYRYLNREVFAPAPEGRRGNSTRGQFRGPGLHVWDLSIRKNVAVSGTVRVQIQADLFNAFNQVNFRNPQTNMQNADFGLISATAPPRNVQLGLRVTF